MRVRTIKNTSTLIYIIVCMSMMYIEFAYRHAILTLFASPCTVRCAKKIVTGAGYENAIYVSHHNELDVLPLIIKTSDKSNLGRYGFVDYYPELGEYLFVADKSGEEYAILVHAGRSEIDATCIIYEGGLLGDILTAYCGNRYPPPSPA